MNFNGGGTGHKRPTTAIQQRRAGDEEEHDDDNDDYENYDPADRSAISLAIHHHHLCNTFHCSSVLSSQLADHSARRDCLKVLKTADFPPPDFTDGRAHTKRFRSLLSAHCTEKNSESFSLTSPQSTSQCDVNAGKLKRVWRFAAPHNCLPLFSSLSSFHRRFHYKKKAKRCRHR